VVTLLFGLAITVVPAVPAAAATGTIEGTVTGPGSVPIDGAEVYVYSDGASYSELTAADGTYSINVAAPGVYEIEVWPPEGSDLVPYLQSEIEVGSGATVTIDVELTDGGTISGHVDLPVGASTSSVLVFVTGSGFGFGISWVEADGSYSVGGLPAGDYYVQFDTDPTSGLRPELYDDAPMPGDADVVTMVGDAEITGIDAELDFCTTPFLDVPTTHRFCVPIQWLESSGIAGGYSDGTFRPGAPITRAAMASFLWKRAGAPTGPFDPPGYSDVPSNHPFATAIAWMADEGIAGGYADGTFRPGARVSRQAMAAFLWRAAGEPYIPPFPFCFFDDVCEDHPFFQPITWLVLEGLADGYDDGTFRPTATVSRQAMASFLHGDQIRMEWDEVFPDEEPFPFSAPGSGKRAHDAPAGWSGVLVP
jgi:hypothetical protein